ncbi:MAG TPA: TetR/AcrR family transcriptional regulator [Candidatus Acidoferrales bacterium]
MARAKASNGQSATARRILAAAEQHFAAHGMAGARTDEISSAAHANKAMLYYYFGDKRRLHRAVLENLFRQLRTGVYAAPADPKQSPRVRLLEFITRYFDFLASHPNYPRLVQREAMEATRDFEWIVQQHLRPSHNQLVRTLDEGIRAGEFRNVDTHQTAFTIMGMTTSYFAAAPILSQVAGHDLMAPKALVARKRALLDFLNHGLLRSKARSR